MHGDAYSRIGEHDNVRTLSHSHRPFCNLFCWRSVSSRRVSGRWGFEKDDHAGAERDGKTGVKWSRVQEPADQQWAESARWLKGDLSPQWQLRRCGGRSLELSVFPPWMMQDQRARSKSRARRRTFKESVIFVTGPFCCREQTHRDGSQMKYDAILESIVMLMHFRNVSQRTPYLSLQTHLLAQPTKCSKDSAG